MVAEVAPSGEWDSSRERNAHDGEPEEITNSKFLTGDSVSF